jgi:hypothetical protein
LQRFDRTRIAIPAIFQSDEARAYRGRFLEFYLSKNEKRSQTRTPVIGRWLGSGETRKYLSALFHNKCAFCEQFGKLQVTHFRPVSEAAPAEHAATSHLYYSWLAGAWENLYLVCTACNSASGRRFPVDGPRVSLPTNAMVKAYVKRDSGEWPYFPIQEKSLLLDPCYDGKFYQHFRAEMSGALVPISKRGTATAEVFRLNRPDLVAARKDTMLSYARYLCLGEVVQAPPPSEREVDIFSFQQLEFGGFWYLILREFAARLPEAHSARSLQPNFIGTTLRRQDPAILTRLFDGTPAASSVAEDNGAPDRDIDTIHIKNFKAIENMTLVLQPPEADADAEGVTQRPALVILGENSAGKSSILEAIALTLCKSHELAALDLASRTLMLTDEYLGGALDARRPATVTISFSDGQHATLDANENGIVRGGAARRRPVFAYGAFRQYLENSVSDSPAKAIVSLFKSDEILTNPEQWLLSLAEDDFIRVARALRDIFSVDQTYDFIKREPSKKRCILINGAAKNAGKTPLSLASSGFRSLLGMLCEVMEGLLQDGVRSGAESFESIHAVVLIDEVEAHMHPRWKMQIMRGLRRALPGVTFIATTHDPLCLRGLKEGEAVVVRRVHDAAAESGALAEKVELLVDLPDLTKLSVEQLLTSDFFGLVSTENSELEDAIDAYVEQTQGRQKDVPTGAAAPTPPALIREIADSLPLGKNTVQQLIEEALLEYLVKRRTAQSAALGQLRDEAKQSILDALDNI